MILLYYKNIFNYIELDILKSVLYLYIRQKNSEKQKSHHQSKVAFSQSEENTIY